MMQPAIAWQEKGKAFYFIADYHALTTVHDPVALRQIHPGRRSRFPRLRAGSGQSRFIPSE